MKTTFVSTVMIAAFVLLCFVFAMLVPLQSYVRDFAFDVNADEGLFLSQGEATIVEKESEKFGKYDIAVGNTINLFAKSKPEKELLEYSELLYIITDSIGLYNRFDNIVCGDDTVECVKEITDTKSYEKMISDIYGIIVFRLSKFDSGFIKSGSGYEKTIGENKFYAENMTLSLGKQVIFPTPEILAKKPKEDVTLPEEKPQKKFSSSVEKALYKSGYEDISGLSTFTSGLGENMLTVASFTDDGTEYCAVFDKSGKMLECDRQGKRFTSGAKEYFVYASHITPEGYSLSATTTTYDYYYDDFAKDFQDSRICNLFVNTGVNLSGIKVSLTADGEELAYAFTNSIGLAKFSIAVPKTYNQCHLKFTIIAEDSRISRSYLFFDEFFYPAINQNSDLYFTNQKRSDLYFYKMLGAKLK